MLGLLRFTLAAFVVIAHLAENIKIVSHLGVFAVFGFYLVSGYLMTAVLNETYSFKFSSFALNRFLRLFPIYYLVAAISVIILILAPDSSNFHPAWNVQFRLIDVLGNSLVFPFEFYDASFRLVPPAWSVAVELICYFLIWLFVARNQHFAIATFSIALTYHVVSLLAGMDWSKRYFPFYAALLPFSIGACIYYSRNFFSALNNYSTLKISGAAFSVWVFNLAICGVVSGLGGSYFDLFFYVNLACLWVLVSCMITPTFSGRLRKSGKLLGDLAYPVFLTHWIVAFLISVFIVDGQRRGLSLLAASVLPILAISFSLSWLADRLLEPLRDKIRNRAKFSDSHPLATANVSKS